MKKALIAAGVYTYSGLLVFVLFGVADEFSALCGCALLLAIVTSAPALLAYILYKAVKR